MKTYLHYDLPHPQLPCWGFLICLYLRDSVNLDTLADNACELLDIRLLDHIIVTPFNGYFSYCDNGRL